MDYLLFESNPPSLDRFTQLHLASDLTEAGHRVTLVLIQDGVFWAIQDSACLAELAVLELTILLDDFSLAVRGYRDMPLPEFIGRGDAADFIAVMARGPVKAIWR